MDVMLKHRYLAKHDLTKAKMKQKKAADKLFQSDSLNTKQNKQKVKLPKQVSVIIDCSKKNKQNNKRQNIIRNKHWIKALFI